MCLSRGSWTRNVPNEEGNSVLNSTEDRVVEVEAENQNLIEPATPSGRVRGTWV